MCDLVTKSLKSFIKTDWNGLYGRDGAEIDTNGFSVYYFEDDIDTFKRLYNQTPEQLVSLCNKFNPSFDFIIQDQETGFSSRRYPQELLAILNLMNKLATTEATNQKQADDKETVPCEETRSARKVAAEYMGEKKQWSRKLIEFRKEHNLSQQELASLLEVTISSVEGWEECKHKPLANSALKIGALFNKFNSASAVTKILGQSPEECLIGRIDKKAFERLVRSRAPKNIVARGLKCTEQLIDTWCNAVYGARYFTVKRRLLKGRI